MNINGVTVLPEGHDHRTRLHVLYESYQVSEAGHVRRASIYGSYQEPKQQIYGIYFKKINCNYIGPYVHIKCDISVVYYIYAVNSCTVSVQTILMPYVMGNAFFDVSINQIKSNIIKHR